MLVPLVAVPPAVLLGGLVLLAGVLVGLLRVLVLRRRLAAAGVPDLDDLAGPGAATPPLPVSCEAAVVTGHDRVETVSADPPRPDSSPARVDAPVEIQVDPSMCLPAHDPAPTAYADLARQLAEVGDLEAAVVTQWAADLQVLAPHLQGQGQVLADLVGSTVGGGPLSTLHEVRAAALTLIPSGGSVQALLSPLDHLADLVPASPRPRGRHAAPVPAHPRGLPAELRELLPAHQLAAYDALAGDGQERSA